MRTPLATRGHRSWIAIAVLVFAGACATTRPAVTNRTPSTAVRHDVAATDGHTLALWEKRPVAATKRGALLLLHGRTWSSLPNFDLQVAGERRSLMDAFTARGYAVYALDLRGYGATPRDATGWLTPERAVEDVATALDWIGRRETGQGRPVLLGLSRGAQVAAFVAQRHPEKLSAVVLLGYAADLDRKIPSTPPDQKPAKEANTAANAGSDFITPGAISPVAKEAFIAAALAADPVRSDWRDEDQFNAVDPAAIKVPVLLIHGEHDPLATVVKGEKLFARLGTGDRAWVIIPGADHAVHLEDAQARLVKAVAGFIERRAP
ncbi:MAG TPA: alpha/beta fold hydrolase [Thermoanaerobaculia bacterium]|jgi:pimeloyl-ACP methyl ester carboxylesterase|nr:alpha/beta fold hydrolase [Thermoanaerobaculia bacterium]